MSDYSFSRASERARHSTVRELLREPLRPGMISLAGGFPQPSLFDVHGIRRAMETVFDENPCTALQYGATEGQISLQVALAEHMQARGMRVKPDSIQITTGSQQAIDLVAQALIDEGDVVALEVPAYLAALQAFSLRGCRYLAIAGDLDGADVDWLERAVSSNAAPLPRIVYVVSNFANPTGTTLSLARRRALLRWAAHNRVFVLEDDPYGDLRFSGTAMPSMWALAQQDPEESAWVGYVSSLSKTLSPGMRVGWMVLPPKVAEATSQIKQTADLHTSSFVQEVAACYLRSGDLEQHIAVARRTYSRQCDALIRALTTQVGGQMEFNVPEGGMFLWCRFGDGVNATALLPRARDCGVSFVPGAAFYPSSGDESTMRLSFSSVTPALIQEAVHRLSCSLKIYRDELRRSSVHGFE